jgi:hypothetical protein
MKMNPKPKPAPKPKKTPSPLKRSYIKVKPKGERRKLSKSERTLLEAELDKLCSEYVRLIDGECVTCHSRRELTCSHFVKRSNQFLRYDTAYNLNCQCKWCNEAHNHEQTAYEDYLVKRHGAGMVETLKKASQATHFSWSVIELREMLQRVKEKLSDLKGE